MMRAQEVGLVDRALKIFVVKKPKCHASAVVHPVTLNGISSAFIILGGKLKFNFLKLHKLI